MRTGGLAVLVLLLAGGCKGRSSSAGNHSEGGPLIGGLGRAIATGPSRELRLTRDGKFAAFLQDAKKPALDGIPPQLLVGSLRIATVNGEGSAAREVGSGVTNAPGGYAFSPDSRYVLFLEGYNPAGQSGTLKAVSLTDVAAAPKRLGEDVTYSVVSPDSKWLAFVDRGTLKVGAFPEGPFREVAGEVQDVLFAPDSSFVLFKRRITAGGALLALRLGSQDGPAKLGESVGDYSISPDARQIAFTQRSEKVRFTYELYLAPVSTFAAKLLSSGVSAFSFSPDSRYLARVEGGRPEVLGDLVVGPAGGGAGRKLGPKVQELAFSPDSKAIGYLESYNVNNRAGVMAVAELPDGAPKEVGRLVPNFSWSPDGKQLAFLARFLQPIFSVDLMLYPLGAEKATKVQTGVFGYGFASKGGRLLLRSSCIREGRACDLLSIDLTKSPLEAPKKILEGVYSFRTSDDGERLLVSYAKFEKDLYDVALYNFKSGERKTLDQLALLPPMFADPEGSKVVYALGDRKRPGVYVADRELP